MFAKLFLRFILLWLGAASIGAMPAGATIPDIVFEGLTGEEVYLEKRDGSTVSGRLVAFDEASVVVARTDGRVVTVVRGDVQRVSIAAAPRPESGALEQGRIAQLRADASANRRSGVINLSVWTPISLVSVATGAYLFLDSQYRAPPESIAEMVSGTVLFALGATGVVMFPIKGGKCFARAAKYTREADRLERSGSSVAPAAWVGPVAMGEARGVQVAIAF